jgi:hypothetical protein
MRHRLRRRLPSASITPKAKSARRSSRNSSLLDFIVLARVTDAFIAPRTGMALAAFTFRYAMKFDGNTPAPHQR